MPEFISTDRLECMKNLVIKINLQLQATAHIEDEINLTHQIQKSFRDTTHEA